MTAVGGSARAQARAYLAWITVCVVWGTTYLAIRVALESIPVALLAGLRWTAAGILLASALVAAGESLPHPRHWGPIAVAGFLMAVIGNGGVVWAEQYVASGLAAVVVATVPFWAVSVDALVPGGDKLTWRTVGGLALGLLGIVVLVWPELTMGGQQGRLFGAGVVALQIACLGWALGTAFTKRLAVPAAPLPSAAMQMLLSGLMLMAIGTATGEWSRLAFTPRTTAAMVYLVLVGSIVGYSAYVYALKHLPVATVSLYAYVNPIIAVVLGTLVLSEPFSLRLIVAALMVLAGIAVVQSAASRKSTRCDEAPTATPCTGRGPTACATP